MSATSQARVAALKPSESQKVKDILDRKEHRAEHRATAPSKLDLSKVLAEGEDHRDDKKSENKEALPRKFKSATIGTLSLQIPDNTPRANPFDTTAMHEILSSSGSLGALYLGGASAARSRDDLKRWEVGYVLNITTEVPNHYESDFNYKRIQIPDEPDADIAAFFDAAVEFIDTGRKAQMGVLVHCLAGMSRSCSLVLAYLVKAEKMTLRDAYWHVKDRRACACPNAGFRGKLLQYEAKVHGNASLDPQDSNWPSSKHMKFIPKQVSTSPSSSVSNSNSNSPKTSAEPEPDTSSSAPKS